jgi:amino acid adenylation domain-containing protein
MASSRLVSSTLRAILRQPAEQPALAIDGRLLSYGELLRRASAIAEHFDGSDVGLHRVVALLACRSVTAYAGVLAAHIGGIGYVPLNPRFPVGRSQSMLSQSKTRTIVVGREGGAILAELIETAEEPCTIIGTDVDFGDMPSHFRRHRFISIDSELPTSVLEAEPTEPDATAYLLFTSGSTGTPKGVSVSVSNLDSYVAYVRERYAFGRHDRVSQVFDPTFDLSVHDMFVTWSSGACLYPLPDVALGSPARFIRENNLTVWFSVPSLAMLMARARTLRRDAFPSLRLSLFCGEPLPVATTTQWSLAAPNSKIVNLYGPTEATIAASAYEWLGEVSVAESRQHLVPLGWIFPSQHSLVIDAQGASIDGAGRGELCLGGTQVAHGYLDDPEKTAQRFFDSNGRSRVRWFRTGDLVERRVDGCLFFLGRIDDQVKVNGYRIELLEIDAVLRRVAGTDMAVAVVWPYDHEQSKGLVGCIAGGTNKDVLAMLGECRRTLPSYMIPTRIVLLEALPLNANGKIDRRALQAILDRDARFRAPSAL